MVRNGNAPNRSGSLASGSEPTICCSVGFSSLRQQDISSILHIERACFPQPWTEEAFLDVVSSRTFNSVAARDRMETLLGYVVLYEVSEELHILNVAVDPALHRQGIGSALLSYVHKKALERGRKFSYLEVRQSNRVAQELYRKLGYRPIHQRKEYYIDNGEDAIVMVADLLRRKP